ncbi:Transmembrane protein [Echinococcus granulosus]|uniref:Transmembrane protein n=1 Tax=Echinococcus granulosus TaxID=6210 RepID=W6UU00_ECHGR|nr:Transmembrane protein [Echinococcus granulosus]EUB56864.1 Transmembrane protein [Echinococcus granulosus]
MDDEEDFLRIQEEGLKSDFQDLKAQIEENEIIHGIPSRGMSSFYIPRDPEHFRRRRKLILQRTLQVTSPMELVVQADQMVADQETCKKGEFNASTIPPLLLQYFLDRMSEIVSAKHLLMLRWKRYCSGTMKVEKVYKDYLQVIERLTEEYLECSSRAHRLSTADEALLAGNDGGLEEVEFDDFLIYWRAIIIKLQSQTYFKQLIQKQPYHLSHYEEDGGIRQMLNLVLEKGPATVRAALANGVSSSTSEDGGEPIEGAVEAPVSAVPTAVTSTAETEKDTDTDEAAGEASAPAAMDAPSKLSNSESNDGVSQRAEELMVHTGGTTSSQDGAAPGAPTPPKSSAVTSTTIGTSATGAIAASVPTESSLRASKKRGQTMTGGIELGAIDQAFRFSEHAPQPPGMFMAQLGGSGIPLPPTTTNIQYAASGGGLVINERYHGLPLHTNDLASIRPHLTIFVKAYGIDINIQTIRSAADEMELFAVINRNFRRLFLEQEEMLTFKTYDATSSGTERWGLDSPSHAMKKPSNWLPFIKLKPKRNADLVKSMMELRCVGNVDEVLRSLAAFLKINKPERVQDALRHHAMLVQHPPIVHAASVVSHRQGMSLSEIFRKIFSSPELYDETTVNESKASGRSTYDFNSAMQMLGLDEQTDAKDDSSSVQGGYLSFLHLRHLKMRDVQRTCISVLNYFRSIERTLTINDQGLSLGGRGAERVSPQNHRAGPELPGHQGGSNNLVGHSYLFSTPRDFRIKESEFMQFADVENHDDFYYHKDCRIHVRDQVGYWIVYDCALDDFNELERDLMLLATHFIQKDKAMRSASNFKRKQTANELMDVYMEAYQHVCSRESRRRLAQVMVDLMYQRPRIELNCTYFVLAYRYECAILRLKTAVMKHCLNAQIQQQREYFIKLGTTGSEDGYPIPLITHNPISPNSDQPALTPCYLLELQPSLAMAANLAEAMQQAVNVTFDMLNPTRMIDELVLEKRFYEVLHYEVLNLEPPGLSYTQALQRDLFASSYVEDAKQMSNLLRERYFSIQDTNTRGDKQQRKAFLLNHLGQMLDVVVLRHRLITCLWETEVLAKIYLRTAIEMGYDEFHLFLRPLQFEAAKYKEGVDEAKLPLYITAIQDDDSVVDKFIPSALPLAIHELDETHVGKFSFRGKVTVAEVTSLVVASILTFLNFSLIHYQLCDERGVENLLVILKTQLTHKNALIAALMLAFNATPSFYSSNLSSRAKKGRSTDQEGTSLAEYTGLSGAQMGPTPLALERAFHMPFMDFHPEAFFSVQLEKTACRDRVMNLFARKTEATAKSKNRAKNSSMESEKLKRDLISQFCDDYSRRAQQTALRGQIIALYASLITVLRKVPNICEEFFTIGTMYEKKGLDDDAEMAKTDPRKLRKRVRRVLSLDGTRFYNLWFIPHFLEVLFVFRQLDDEAATRALRSMCRVASALHDIVHYLVAFARLGINGSKLSAEQRDQIYAMASETVKTMVHELHPTSSMEYANRLAANAAANSSTAKLVVAGTTEYLAEINEQPAAMVTPEGLTLPNGQSLLIDQAVEEISSFDGGPMSNLAQELREIQTQINMLPDPQDPDQVVNLLNARREYMFLLLDVCLSSVLSETFLATGNEEAYRELVDGSRFPLGEMSNRCQPSLEALEMPIPEPLEPQDERACKLYPWLSFLNSAGPFTIQYPRPTVHGELLSLMLALEDVLETGDVLEASAGQPLPVEEYENLHYLLGRRFRNKRKEVAQSAPVANAATPSGGGGGASRGGAGAGGGADEPEAKDDEPGQSIAAVSHPARTETATNVEVKLSIVETPIAAYALIKKYLILRKRVELMKREWGKRRLGLESIDTAAAFKQFTQVYRREHLFPLLRSLSIQYKQPEIFALGPFQETDVQISPKGIPEMVLLQRQLVKLIEAFENYMIGDVRKMLVRQIDLVIKERNREEGNLPLELWKKPAMKESLTVQRPALVDEVLENLLDGAREDTVKKTITFDTEHLNKFIQNVTIGVMRMQREAYENYAMYYENLLKNQHMLLYAREREVASLREQLKQKELETEVNVQFQMSEQAHNLLLEVTALRAKLAENADQTVHSEAKVRDQVRREFSAAMRKLFALSFEQKARIDEYRNHLHAVTLKRISEVRDEAALEMERIKEKSGAKSSAEDELAERNLRLSREINNIHQKNIHLQQMVSRLKSMSTWKENTLHCVFEKQMKAVEDQRNKSKTQVNRLGMLSEQRVRNLSEEMTKLRENLSSTHKELDDLRRQLDKELKDKVEKRNIAERKAATEKQIANIKQMHIEKLLGDIAGKNEHIAELNEQLAVHEKTKRQVIEKAMRDIDNLKKRLADERKLKKIAIHKVDDLLSQVYEYETAFAINQTPAQTGNTAIVATHLGGTDQKGIGSAKFGGIKSACRKYNSSITAYDDLLKRFKVPYTPQHYLDHRRKMVMVPRLQQHMAHEILNEQPPATHEEVVEAQNLEEKRKFNI